MIFASEINDLIDLFGFVSWAIYGLALACVVILRFSKPNVDRPFRVSHKMYNIHIMYVCTTNDIM